MTREEIEKRKAQLQSEKDELAAQIAQLQANLYAYNGALQDCDYWLMKVSQPVTMAVPVVDLTNPAER